MRINFPATRPNMRLIVAPFSESEVASINGFQQCGAFHPFTCGTASCPGVLIAAADGWKCPLCDYHQDWAHGFMADSSWRSQAGTGE